MLLTPCLRAKAGSFAIDCENETPFVIRSNGSVIIAVDTPPALEALLACVALKPEEWVNVPFPLLRTQPPAP